MSTTGLLSIAERTWIIQSASLGTRQDGRDVITMRPTTVETGVLSGTLGSARVKRGGTDVVVGIKAELCDAVHKGEVNVYVDCAVAGAASQDGGGGIRRLRDLEKFLSQSLGKALSAAFDAKKLVCAPGLAWIIWVDCLVQSWSGGSLMDVLSVGIKSAMMNLRLPVITPRKTAAVGGTAKPTRDFSVSDDPCDFIGLDTSDIPVFATIALLGDLFIVDPTAQEEECCVSKLRVAVKVSGELSSIQQEGIGGMNPARVFAAMALAKHCGDSVHSSIASALAQEAAAQRPKSFSL